MAAQRLEEGLKAAVDGAAEDSPVNLDPRDPGRAFDLAGRRRADEHDLHALHRHFFGHRHSRLGRHDGPRIRGITESCARASRRVRA